MDAERRFLMLSIALPPLILAAFLIGYFAKPGLAAGDLALVAEAYERMQQRYDGDIDAGEMRRTAIESMLANLDPYSAYFTTEDWNRFQEDHTKKDFGGIGVVVEPDPDQAYIRILTVLGGTPADGAELLPGDRITAVDGRSLKNKGLEYAVRWIRGKEGSTVTLTIWREEVDPFDVDVMRARIEVPAIRAKILDPAGSIGYLRIVKFSELIDEFDQKYAELEKQGVKSLIVDLRFNGGGLLQQSILLADRFLDEGTIVSTRGKASDEDVEEADREATTVRIPLVLLVNGESASASEVFAGAIRDHKRGALVGSRTFGKGLVQTPIPLSDGSWIKLTTARYYTPSGVSVHRIEGKKDYGIEPDYVIETTREEWLKIHRMMRDDRYGIEVGEEFTDPQLKAAIEIARARMEDREPDVEPRLVKKK